MAYRQLEVSGGQAAINIILLSFYVKKGRMREWEAAMVFLLSTAGSFLMEAEKDQIDRTRLICGIHPDNFSWTLHGKDTFWTPEVMMTHSGNGMGKADCHCKRGEKAGH